MPADKLQSQLEQKKQIDVVCDRFELAWTASPKPPRIEEFLNAASATDRALLFGELLASELALKSERGQAVDRAEYDGRFPDYVDVVAEIFQQRTPQSTLELGCGERAFEIIQAFRSCQQSGPAEGGDLAGLRSALVRFAGKEIPTSGLAAEQALWLAIVRVCLRLDALQLAGVETVVQQLLEAFSPLRRSILMQVLVGHTIGAAARANNVTERTADSTVQVATLLADQAG